MFFKTLKVENWKSFKRQYKWHFKNQELIVDENGSGKTSKFQAIQYAIWGKYPSGFNANSVRNDPEKNALVELLFTFGDNEEHEGFIKRIFGAKSVAELWVDGELIAESVRTIEAEMNRIVNFNIASQIWTNSMTDSDILSSRYFTDVVLQDVLHDANELSIKFKTKIRASNKVINSFDEELIDGETIKQELEEVENSLSNNQERFNDRQYEQAKLTEQAHIKLKELKEAHPIFEISRQDAKEVTLMLGEMNSDEIKEYQSTLRATLKVEESKKDSPFKNFNRNDILNIAKESMKLGYCLICGDEYTQGHFDRLQGELNKPIRSQIRIDDLKNQLEVSQYDIEEARLLRKYYQLKEQVDKNPNYMDIIEKFNKDQNSKWDEYRSLQQQYQKYLIQQDKIKKVSEEKQNVTHWRGIIEVLTTYISDATKYYTERILDKATENLESINPRYKGVYIEGKSFTVTLENVDHQISVVPVVQMSSGEKTMVALSLLFAVHDIMVPELPFLFDEVFSALDSVNLEQVREFLKKQQSQIFVISHDNNWKEF